MLYPREANNSNVERLRPTDRQTNRGAHGALLAFQFAGEMPLDDDFFFTFSDRSVVCWLCIVTKWCKTDSQAGLWCVYKSNRNVGFPLLLVIRMVLQDL